jgi:epoxyqueuosine reductase
VNAAAHQPEASARDLTASLKSAAHRLGFALVGVCPAVAPTGVARLTEWLDRGYAGQMHYLSSRRSAYDHPRHVLPGVRSIVMLGLPYGSRHTPCSVSAGQGRISSYACGTDYHDVVHDKLKQLLAFLYELAPDASARGVVDSAPLLEREFAQLAGLGWAGKHTLLINKPAGSYFFLAALLTDLDLEADEPFTADHCGTCRACLDACPTNAFPQPYVLDATRCISYLTIELRDHIPADLRSGIGDWLFGCDICQEVCPWNRHAPGADEPLLQPADRADAVDLIALFDLDDEAFRHRFRHTPLWRARRRGILRNAAIILGNQKVSTAVPTLTHALSDPEPLIRGASAWALGQIGAREAAAAIAQRLPIETDEAVQQELLAASSQMTSDQ